MIPFLIYPLALIALVSLPALAAIYLLRNRFRRRQVSSLMLWRFRLQSKEGGTRLNRLQLPLVFFLELLALLLLVIAAAGPHWKLPQAARPLIVVLDDSLSMRAVSAGASARTRARESLERLFRFQPPPSARLVLAGTEPRLLGGPVRNGSELTRLLGQWTCQAPLASLDRAISLASELGQQQANILVLTDQAPGEDRPGDGRKQWRGVGIPAANVAIVNASRTAGGDQDRCLIEIANFSDSPLRPGIVVRAGSNSIQRTQLALAPRERQRLVFNLPASTPRIEAQLDEDALADDNRVQLLPPVRKRVRVRVALTNAALNALVVRALDATGLRAALSENPDLIVHESDSSPADNAWSLCWRSPDNPTAYTGPFIVDSAHPAVQGLALNGAVWAAGQGTPPPGALPLILAGNVPLLSAREDVLGRQFLTLTLNAELSTVQTTPDWPVFFWNLLAWRAAQLPGLLESNARLGTEVLLTARDESVAVTWPDGTVRSYPRTGGQIALETPLPGIYEVSTRHATNSFAVNPLAADESDLSTCATGQWEDWADDAEARYARSPMAWMFALAALGVLTAHLCLLAVGKGGGA